VDDTTRVLVLANRTADSSQLRDALLERRDRGPIEVTLLVPAAWEAQDPHGGVETGRRRVRAALANLRDTGLEVRCHLGDPDPVTALREAWDPERYDEVIVSTLPGTVSRWLRSDLPQRLGRAIDAQVTHVLSSPRREPVTAEPAPARERPPLGPLAVLAWGHPRDESEQERTRRLRDLR
jgi:hypothetical protein